MYLFMSFKVGIVIFKDWSFAKPHQVKKMLTFYLRHGLLVCISLQVINVNKNLGNWSSFEQGFILTKPEWWLLEQWKDEPRQLLNV